MKVEIALPRKTATPGGFAGGGDPGEPCESVFVRQLESNLEAAVVAPPCVGSRFCAPYCCGLLPTVADCCGLLRIVADESGMPPYASQPVASDGSLCGMA